jgi:hypothetical protein
MNVYMVLQARRNLMILVCIGCLTFLVWQYLPFCQFLLGLWC